MNFPVENVIDHFLRTYEEIFSAHEIISLFNSFGCRIKTTEVTDFLDNDERVFPLEKKLYITRAGVFTGMFFSFVPSAIEIAQKAFIIGDRCVPFVDPEILSCSLQFEYAGKNLKKKIIKANSSLAASLFTLFGDEYVSQYIAADPANKNMKLAANSFELPSEVNLTAVSLENVFKDTDFSFGDRILCRVKNWDSGIVEIFPITRHKMNPFQMNSDDIEHSRWNEILESALLESFDKTGPCHSIEQQLANVFYENRNLLCEKECGSIHEFLSSTRKVSMQFFGVETRIWKQGEDVPAIGNWNKEYSGIPSGVAIFDLPDYVIDCYLKDQMFEKKDDVRQVVEKMIPDEMFVTKKEKESFALQIKNRNDILRRKYNWFADFTLGGIRHKALELYSKVGSLVYDVDCAAESHCDFPQQELVTLSQLFTHILRILETLSGGRECADDEAAAIELSLEGMEYNFEDIRPQLKAAVDRFNAAQFKII